MTGQDLVKLLGAAVCLAVGYALKSILTRNAQQSADNLIENAKREAEAILKDAKITAKEEVIKARDDFEKTTTERRTELKRLEDRLSSRETNIERKADLIETRFHELEKKEDRARQGQREIEEKQAKLDEMITQEVGELERIAGLGREEAKRQLLQRLGEQLESERGALIRRFQDETNERFEREAIEIMVNAMQRYSSDCSYERTTRTIPLPNEEMKGRIIGREGRNIRAIEAAAGVNVLIDDTPEAVVISCFDPVRREIGRLTLERLVSDGRIHPSRIEEMTAKVRKDVEAEIAKAGRETVEQLNLTGVSKNVVKLLGRLKYRYSYSQNVLQHSIEVASLMGAIAAQLHLDEQKAKRAGLFHDIGKAVDHEVEGTHALIGADILKRAGEDEEVVMAVGAHHEEMDNTSVLGILVGICDTLSASRPGARSETTELYLKRLEQMETIGASFEGIENCYAVQAGRELRVIAEADKISEDKAAVVARDIANRIEQEVRYPGQIKVSVIRETRAVDYAR